MYFAGIYIFLLFYNLPNLFTTSFRFICFQFFDEIPDTDSLAPKAVAEYLFLTGDRASFNAATADLLKSGIVSHFFPFRRET